MQKITQVFCHTQVRVGLCFCHRCIKNCGIWEKKKKSEFSHPSVNGRDHHCRNVMGHSSASSTHHFSQVLCHSTGIVATAHFVVALSSCVVALSAGGTACQATLLCLQLCGCKVCRQRGPMGLCSTQQLGVH